MPLKLMGASFCNFFGIVFAFIGTVIWFFTGPPQKDYGPGVGVGLEPNSIDPRTRLPIKDSDIAPVRKKKRDRFWAYVGLSLIAVGFFLQPIAAYPVTL